MFKFRKALLAGAALLVAVAAVAQGSAKYPGVGRDATPKEVAAWDIDVRPDFKGLPTGSGSVAKGQDVWESKCAHCHGYFGESGEVFSPLVGGVTKEDIKSGNVANLRNSTFPGRTTFMKVPTISTIWDYINRAMPWTAPKTLTTEEVYAVTAFLLNLNGIVPDNYVLSDKNMADVQAKMPNRNGMTTAHSMWPGSEFKGAKKADTSNTACMKDCAPEPQLASFLPEFARNAHGNLAEQNRMVGAQRGADTSRPEMKSGSPSPTSINSSKPVETKASVESKAVVALMNKNNCLACHGLDKKIVGPALYDVAKKNSGNADYLAKKIKSGGSGVWGAIPMPPQSLSDADAQTIASWLAAGAGK
ncbi:MAG: cytochrome C [Burkholderiales bacterium PBB4]|nr:MAG: cytochrome C [Burkholderiales bacterium PBB4]